MAQFIIICRRGLVVRIGKRLIENYASHIEPFAKRGCHNKCGQGLVDRSQAIRSYDNERPAKIVRQIGHVFVFGYRRKKAASALDYDDVARRLPELKAAAQQVGVNVSPFCLGS